MDWLRDHPWEAWLVVAMVLIVAELFSLDLFLAMCAVGALAGMVTSMLTDTFAVQAAVAAVVAIAMLAVVRPSLARRLHTGPDPALGNARLLGMRGVVTEEVAPMRPGRARLDGEIWSVSADVESLLPVGSTVEVVEIRGATAHVRPVPADSKER